MDYNLKGGVLIIGSLFWQDDLEPLKKDGARKNWRNNHLEMNLSTKVTVPIRYGRFSGSPKKGNQTYTMIFDKELIKEKLGIAWAVAFKHNPSGWKELKNEVEELSRAEGNGSEFIKYSKVRKEVWCVCTICFNPKISKEIKVDILSNWEQPLMESKDGYKYFLKAPENLV